VTLASCSPATRIRTTIREDFDVRARRILTSATDLLTAYVELADGAFVRGAFGTYLPTELVEELPVDAAAI
jgi:hypothetical protein